MNSNDQPKKTDSRASDDSDRKGPLEPDPDSPGATIDDPEPAEPNEPG